MCIRDRDEILNSGYDEIIYIPMSSGLSASCEAAMGLALDYDGKVQVANNPVSYTHLPSYTLCSISVCSTEVPSS